MHQLLTTLTRLALFSLLSSSEVFSSFPVSIGAAASAGGGMTSDWELLSEAFESDDSATCNSMSMGKIHKNKYRYRK